MSDGPESNYDLPDDFNLARADHLERVETAEGVTLVVLKSARSGERQLVHADVIDYDGLLEHPITTGVLGFFAVLGALLAPLAGSYALISGTDSGVVTVAVALGGVVGAWLLANVTLYRTVGGDWLFRFLEWNDHKHLLVGRDLA